VIWKPGSGAATLLGKVGPENEFLKKSIRLSLKQTEKKESSLPQIRPH
jgi:hypothetical protein